MEVCAEDCIVTQPEQPGQGCAGNWEIVGIPSSACLGSSGRGAWKGKAEREREGRLGGEDWQK